MNPILTQQEKEKFEPMAKILAANGIAQSLSYTLERKYLNGITANSSPMYLELLSMRQDLPSAPYWIKLSQVGKPIADSAEKCFSAIQKILTTCFIPNKVQLIFLVHGKNGIYEMYLGLRSLDKEQIDATFVDGLSNFIKGMWPGLKCRRIKGNLDSIKTDIIKDYDCIDAITGIPSMESQYKIVYPATIDTFLAGMQKKNFTYMVIADPVKETDIDGILYQIRDFNGQAESLKSFNFSENSSDSMSTVLTESKSVSDGTNNSTSKKSAWGMVGAGLMLASYIFPPAGAITTALAIAAGANTIASSNLLGDFCPTHGIGKSHSESITKGKNETTGYSQGKAISTNIVNKQIEAVTEHLLNHGKRFETGKAIGCWSVGVYIMAETKHDIQGASMQLKSIVSGQESVLEPIRVHHIEELTNSILPQTLGNMYAPAIRIKSVSGSFFDHPLGEHFNDLRTLLTTKELAYYINFPQKSVPGISVVNATPEFNLNEQQISESEKSILFGKMLYGGAQTNMDVKLPINLLSRHALVCGVNGSGKTNTVLSVLDGFMKADRPFFVIEPAKTEYVDWAIEYNKIVKDPKKKIKIFIPGCERYAKGEITPDKLRLNPFEVINLPDSEMRVISHIDRLKATFASAFPMQDILPVIMEHLLYKLYTDKHQMLDKDDKANYMKKGFPTLTTVNAPFIDELMSDIGYAKENTQNISAALRTRFQSLKYGWKNELLNNEKLSGKTWNDDKKAWENNEMTWEELFGSPVVVNLSYAGDDQDRAFIMSLLLQFLYEYRIAESETGKVDFNSNKCRHLVVVEEAHRVMANCLNPELPQYKSGQMFSNFLSEVRAYGQGMMVVDQVPTRLIEDAIKNTNVKIIHKLVASDDSQRIAECIGLTQEQQKVIAKLSIGQAVLAGFNSANVGSSDSSDIYLAQINKMK